MIRTREGDVTPSAPERAEQILNRTGQQIGMLAWQARQRFQQATHAFREEAGHMNLPSALHRQNGTGTEQSDEIKQPATQRAEELVDQLGQRVGHWATVNGQQARRAMARLREDAEDMWVEAQGKRTEWMGKRRHV